MFTATDIEQLILHEKKTKHWELGWFTLILVLAVLMFVVGRLMAWEETGYKLGNMFVPLLAGVPLFRWRQRGNIVTALEMLKEKLASVDPDTDEAREIQDVLIGRVRKMLEG